MTAGKTIIEIEALSVNFGGIAALSDVSFAIRGNETLSLIGPNGAGKTTLLNVIAGNCKPTSGQVIFKGRSIQDLPAEQINRLGIGRTFQAVEVFEHLTVRENVMAGGVAGTDIGLLACLSPWGRARHVAATLATRAQEILETVGLGSCADLMGSGLPAGQQRLLGIARVLMTGARILLLDEPGAGLNESEKAALVAVIRRLAAQGHAIVVVEHDMTLVGQVSDRIVVLDQGRLIAEGPPAEVKQAPAVVEAYLGRSREHVVTRLRTVAARAERVLEIKSLSVQYRGVHALQDVSINVDKGEIVALLGANGAGKSSLVLSVAGFVKPASGHIRFNGDDLSKQTSPDAVIRKGINLIPERRALLPSLTVTDNLALGYYTARHNKWGLRGLLFPGLNRDDEIEARMRDAFDLFPILEERRNQKAGLLSGGQSQMLAIAQSLMSSPKLLMLDEPSLGLAPKIVDEILHKLTQLSASGLSILLIEQNARAALQIADRAYVLSQGRVVAQGASESLLEDEHVSRAYLGWDDSAPEQQSLRSAL